MIYNQILVAIDGSEDSLRAAEKVREIGEKTRKVVLFNSIEHHLLEKMQPLPISITGPSPVPPITSSEIRNAKISKAKKLLKKTKNIFRGTVIPVETRVIEDEEPEDYIIRIAEEEGFDLVALGCKGEHSKLKRMIMGTVATKVLNEAPCDILIVR